MEVEEVEDESLRACSILWAHCICACWPHAVYCLLIRSTQARLGLHGHFGLPSAQGHFLPPCLCLACMMHDAHDACLHHACLHDAWFHDAWCMMQDRNTSNPAAEPSRFLQHFLIGSNFNFFRLFCSRIRITDVFRAPYFYNSFISNHDGSWCFCLSFNPSTSTRTGLWSPFSPTLERFMWWNKNGKRGSQSSSRRSRWAEAEASWSIMVADKWIVRLWCTEQTSVHNIISKTDGWRISDFGKKRKFGKNSNKNICFSRKSRHEIVWK